MSSNIQKVVIVGGVAGGASAAVRLRRLSEAIEIVVFERGPDVSFANCGLPYFVGGEIPRKADLLLHTPESLRRRFNLDIRIRSEVQTIDRAKKEVSVRETDTGYEYTESYDVLILSTGATPVRPPIPGIDREGHFTVRSVSDVSSIDTWLRTSSARRAVVIGGGFIGLEMAEQLQHRGLDVSVVEVLPQVMAPFDPEMAAFFHAELRSHGIGLHLDDGVAAFEPPTDQETALASVVVLKSGTRLPADCVILGIGTRPETKLAVQAGLDMGVTGGIRVDDGMKTSDPSIYAVGDSIEVQDAVTGKPALIPLAGPANRQGRVAADQIFGNPASYKGTLGTAILRLFDQAGASVGASEKTLKKYGISYKSVYLHPGSHAGYYPGATPIALKVIFSPEDGKVLGAQAIGKEGVDKRIDVIATVMHGGGTVRDLAELELAYAPPFGSAKDPVNLAGMAACNVLDGLVENVYWDELDELNQGSTMVLDVRNENERRNGAIPGSVHIPLPELRERIDELPRDRDLVVYCHSGQRSYFASRMLALNGFNVRNLTGAWRTYSTAINDRPKNTR